MVEFIRNNPTTVARHASENRRLVEDQQFRQEEQGFRNRYAHETVVGVDNATRTALKNYHAGGSTPVKSPASSAGTATPVSSSGGAPLSSSSSGGVPATSMNQSIANELMNVPGGGAEALKHLTMDQDRVRDRNDQLEDRAWSMLANAKGPEDLGMANSLFKQATGRDLPPQWKTRQAVLKAARIDAAAQQRYPRDIVQRRQFIQEASTKGLNAALTSMVGESAGGKKSLTAQQVFNMAKSRFTTEDPTTLAKTTDWDSVQAAMAANDYEAEGRAIIGGEMNAGDPQGLDYETAMQRAMAEAEDLNPNGPDALRWDAMEEAYGGKSEEQWITNRAQELMGGQPTPAVGTPMTPQQLKAQYGNNVPVGTKIIMNGAILQYNGKTFDPVQGAPGDAAMNQGYKSQHQE